ncbi:MAG TPA: FAD:protein FMN transferase [Gammaproteobacteria bacterium]|nr:FAD:protein FMN transferase [Gammaproteobacteria bacterium]
MMNRLLPASLILLVLVSCSQPEPPLHSRTVLAFGTLIDISIANQDSSRAEQAMDALERDFNWMQEAWTSKGRNALRRVNQLFATGEWFSAAPSNTPLIKAAIPLARQSDQLFNPAIGKLIKLWNFDDSSSDRQPPDPDRIDQLTLSQPNMSDVEFNGILIHSLNPDLELNFGAFGKGYGIDRAINKLKDMGFSNALINAGGDLRAIGQNHHRPWRIGIRHPRNNGIIASLETEGDESIFTSGDYERYYMYEGKRYHHIIDPRSGYPARGSMSVTVIHSDATTADAAATALFIAGPKDWHRIARQMGIRYVMLIAEDGSIHMNPAMAKRITIANPATARIIISKPLN